MLIYLKNICCSFSCILIAIFISISPSIAGDIDLVRSQRLLEDSKKDTFPSIRTDIGIGASNSTKSRVQEVLEREQDRQDRRDSRNIGD